MTDTILIVIATTKTDTTTPVIMTILDMMIIVITTITVILIDMTLDITRLIIINHPITNITAHPRIGQCSMFPDM
jgi:hypothetical protein